MHEKICGHCGAEDSDLLQKIKKRCKILKVKVKTAVSSVCFEEFWQVLTWIIWGGKWKCELTFRNFHRKSTVQSALGVGEVHLAGKRALKPVRFQWVGAVSFQLPEAARWRSRVRWLFQCCHSSRGWLHGCSLARGSCRAGFHADTQTGRRTTRGKSQF